MSSTNLGPSYQCQQINSQQSNRINFCLLCLQEYFYRENSSPNSKRSMFIYQLNKGRGNRGGLSLPRIEHSDEACLNDFFFFWNVPVPEIGHLPDGRLAGEGR